MNPLTILNIIKMEYIHFPPGELAKEDTLTRKCLLSGFMNYSWEPKIPCQGYPLLRDTLPGIPTTLRYPARDTHYTKIPCQGYPLHWATLPWIPITLIYPARCTHYPDIPCQGYPLHWDTLPGIPTTLRYPARDKERKEDGKDNHWKKKDKDLREKDKDWREDDKDERDKDKKVGGYRMKGEG